jgi:hypothetical protein
MSYLFQHNETKIIIDGVTRTAKLVSWQTGVGARPAEAIVNLITEDAMSFDYGMIRGRDASIRIDGRQLLSGHVYDTKGDLSLRNVLIRVLDRRHMLNKDWVGRRHLGADGLPVLGADIIFNLDGKPNKDKNALQFVYERNNIGEEEDCEVVEAERWTRRNIILWLIENYMDDVRLRTENDVPNYGGLEKECEQIDLTFVPVCEAVDIVLAGTVWTWTLDENDRIVFFSRKHPVGLTMMRFENRLSPVSNKQYTLEHPVVFDVSVETSNIITDLTIVGGKKQKEIMCSVADFLPVQQQKEIQPADETDISVVGTHLAMDFKNYNNAERYIHRFDKARYEAHALGKNIRRKDPAKRCLSELLLKRDKEGNYVSPESECGVSGVGTQESLMSQYRGGVSINLDRAEIVADKNSESNGDDTPTRWVVVMENEQRAYVTVTEEDSEREPIGKPVARRRDQTSGPLEFHRAVVRADLVHQEREEVKILVPVYIYWSVNAETNSHTWTATPQITIPSYATLDFALSGGGTITPLTDPPPTNFHGGPTMTLPAGTVFDAEAALRDIGEMVKTEIGMPASQINGAFPTFMPSLKLGLRVMTTPSRAFGAMNTELIVAMSYNGNTERFDFLATNSISGNINTLANDFLDRKKYQIHGGL